MKPSAAFVSLAMIALAAAHAQPPDSPKGATPAPSASVQQILASSNQDRQWRPTAEQRELVLRDTRAYLKAKDDHRFADAYARFTAVQKATVPFKPWEADMRGSYGSAGKAEGRTLNRVTWYKDPPNVPSGVYAAVDFSSRFSGLGLHCGFLALQQQPDGSFGVAREEENSIPKAEMNKFTPEMLQKVKAQFRC
jgi:hypothetical protein